MKQIAILILKGLLAFTLVALALLLVFGAVLMIGWPWWVGFFVLLGLIGLSLGGLVFVKFLKRRQEQMFVHQVIAQDESAYQRMGAQEQNSARELQERWKEAIQTLRRSHLRKYGNPLYVLPWYMVIGESGSGKTTAIKSARLSSPFAEVTKTSGISGTRNCDWWFFEQAILIDTAGRYAIPVDEGRDKDEWQAFLRLLAKFRKKEPLNGLVVTVAADRLSQNTIEALQEDGRRIRSRIDELMRVLGARFPVYVLVTKCDLIQGATQFCQYLPDSALNQAMGVLNHQLRTDVQAFVESALRSVSDRLRDLRLLLLNKAGESGSASSLILFPEEFEKLHDSLTAFITSAFQENPYQESPLIRGVFFSSGRQEGTPFSHFLNALGLIAGGQVLKGESKGLFLHDLFAKILPTDRRLFKPTQYMAHWRRLTRNMGLTAWIAVVVAACGLLSYAFVKNLTALSDVRQQFQKPSILQGDLLTDVMTLDSFRQSMVKVEDENRSWWIPRLGLNTSLSVEKALKHKYVQLFRNGLADDFDRKLGDRLTDFDAGTPNRTFGAHVAHLVRRINMLKARIGGRELSQLAALPQPSYTQTVIMRKDVIPEIEARLGQQYLYATAWQQDTNILNKELNFLQTWLKHLITIPDRNLNWLVEWVENDPSVKPITLHDFWGGEVEAVETDLAQVPAAFTRIGHERILAAIAEIEAALFDPLLMAGAKIAFHKWYGEAYIKAWQDFIQTFDQGRNLLKRRENWQTIAKQIPRGQGPYNDLINRMAEEFEDFSPENPVPVWIAQVYAWQQVSIEARAKDIIDPSKSGIISKAKRSVSSKISKAEMALGVKTRKNINPEIRLKAAKAVAIYQKGLEEALPSTDSRNVAFQMATELYQQDAATGAAPLLAAKRALDQVKMLIGQAKQDSAQSFWELLNGNIQFMLQYTNKEAACLLQDRWEKDVLVEIQNVSIDQDMGQLMMGSNGYAARFIAGPAAPFISRSISKGYYARQVLGQDLNFEKAFLSYLSKGAKAARPRKSRYSVKIKAYPTDTNRNARLRPHATMLELQCGDETTRLENLNYPVAKTFVWSPQSCGDVTFQISVGNLILTKRYTGYNAFAKFLDDFKTGQKRFSAEAFPNEQAALRRLGISYIRARYHFQGHQEALQMLYTAPGRPPGRIIACWEP